MQCDKMSFTFVDISWDRGIYSLSPDPNGTDLIDDFSVFQLMKCATTKEKTASGMA